VLTTDVGFVALHTISDVSCNGNHTRITFRAVSAAFHTPQLEGPTLSQGPKFQPLHYLALGESFDPPNWNVKP